MNNDILSLFNSKSKRAGERTKASVQQFIERKLRLKVNENKTAVERPWKRKFLGSSFTFSKDPKVRIAKDSLKRMKEKVREITSRKMPYPLEYRIKKLNQYLMGWYRGIKIARNGAGYKRTSVKNGKSYYTYNHLVTTIAYPTLMPLRVELHVNDEKSVVLNGGHDSTEIVYITKGKIRMNWEYNNEIHEEILEVGDSAYIHPGVSHSFTTLGDEEAELIAVNW